MKLTYKKWKRAHKVFRKVVKHYGPSSYFPDPQLILLHEPRFKKIRFGTWDQPNLQKPPEVCINFARCKTWDQVVGTIVHEVWHNHQSPNWVGEKGYEKEARWVVKTDAHLFL